MSRTFLAPDTADGIFRESRRRRLDIVSGVAAWLPVQVLA